MNFKRRYYLFMTRKTIPLKKIEPIFVYNYEGAEIEVDEHEVVIDKKVKEMMKRLRKKYEL